MRNPGLFWTQRFAHDATLYLIDKNGRSLGSCIVHNTRNFDWEDIASFPWQGKPYLLVADTGNNGMNAAVQMLHLVEEPPADPRRGLLVKEVRVLETLSFSYEDDFRDCEALGVDPTDRTVLLVSKARGLGGHVYELRWPARVDPKRLTWRRIAALKLPPATGLSISPDGRRAIVITYENAYEFRRGEKEDWGQTFARPAREISMPYRVQGESICYGADGRTLYLTSERLPTPLWEVPAVRGQVSGSGVQDKCAGGVSHRVLTQRILGKGNWEKGKWEKEETRCRSHRGGGTCSSWAQGHP